MVPLCHWKGAEMIWAQDPPPTKNILAGFMQARSLPQKEEDASGIGAEQAQQKVPDRIAAKSA